jgi:hypothetical protein
MSSGPRRQPFTHPWANHKQIHNLLIIKTGTKYAAQTALKHKTMQNCWLATAQIHQNSSSSLPPRLFQALT